MKRILINFVAKHSTPFAFNMVNGLVENGYEVYAIVSKNMDNLEKWENVKNLRLYKIDGYTNIRSFPFKVLKYLFKESKRIRRFIKNKGSFSMYIPINTYWAFLVKKTLPKMKCVYAMHDPIPHNQSWLIINSLNILIARDSDVIQLLSKRYVSYVNRRYHIDSNRIVVIPEGKNTFKINNSDKRIIEYDQKKTNYLFQGRIDKYKGLAVLADAYKKLSLEYEDISLTIAGSGDISPYIKKLNELNNCTIINRWLEDEEIAALYNDNNVITVLPYISATQSGVAIVAMTNGSPIISTKCGALQDQIVDGYSGYLVKPNNSNELYKKMKYVHTHQEEWGYIRENGYRHMKELNWNELAKRLYEVL